MREQKATAHAWLAIDPGVTTGWAVVADDGGVLGTGNMEEARVESTLDTLVRGMHSSGVALDVIIERMPRTGQMSELGETLERVRSHVHRVVVETYELPTRLIPPGEWKPSRAARTTKLKRGKYTTHQRDAIRMALYAMSAYEPGEQPK